MRQTLAPHKRGRLNGAARLYQAVLKQQPGHFDALYLLGTVASRTRMGVDLVPVGVLLPFSPDWRRLLGRDDSPLYPGARLFRRSAIGDRTGVVDQMARAVRSAHEAAAIDTATRLPS